MMNLAPTNGSISLDGELFMGMGEALSQTRMRWEPPAQLGQLKDEPQKKDGNLFGKSIGYCEAYILRHSESLAFMA